MYTDFCALLSSTDRFFVLFASQLSFTAMPTPRRSQKKDRFVIDFILACTFLSSAHFLSCSSYRDQSAASLQKRCGPCFVYLFFLTLFDAFTAGNVLLQLDPLLLMAAMMPRLMPFSPNVSKRLQLAVLKSMLCPLTLSRML